jgi:hypothetical protein
MEDFHAARTQLLAELAGQQSAAERSGTGAETGPVRTAGAAAAGRLLASSASPYLTPLPTNRGAAPALPSAPAPAAVQATTKPPPAVAGSGGGPPAGRGDKLTSACGTPPGQLPAAVAIYHPSVDPGRTAGRRVRPVPHSQRSRAGRRASACGTLGRATCSRRWRAGQCSHSSSTRVSGPRARRSRGYASPRRSRET